MSEQSNVPAIVPVPAASPVEEPGVVASMVTNYEFRSIVEVNVTIRYGIVTAGIVLGLWVVLRHVYLIMAIEQPPWLTLSLAVLGGVVFPVVSTVLVIARHRYYMSHDHQRLVALEKSVNPTRDSSGLQADGSPNDVV